MSRESNHNENTSAEEYKTTIRRVSTPRVEVIDIDCKTETHYDDSGSSTETEMSSSHHPSSSVSKGKHSLRSKSDKEEDWTQIKDPERRRRVQNKLAQRKFRDKTKEKKEREERDTENRERSYQVYETLNPQVVQEENNPSGLPWGSMSLKPVFSRRQPSESESRRASQSQSQGTQSPYQCSPSQHSPSQPIYEDPEQDGIFEVSNLYDGGDRAFYDHQSETGSRGGSIY